MLTNLIKISIIILAVMTYTNVASAKDNQQDLTKTFAKNHFIGDENAPVVMYEFFAFSCPHCAKTATTVLPEIVDDYVKTGKLKIVFIGLPVGPQEFIKAHLLTETVSNGEDFYKLTKAYFNFYPEELTEKTIKEAFNLDKIKTHALLFGINQDTVDKIINTDVANNQDLKKQLKTLSSNLNQLNIEGTPAFFIIQNGESLTANSTHFEGFTETSVLKKAIEEKIQ